MSAERELLIGLALTALLFAVNVAGLTVFR